MYLANRIRSPGVAGHRALPAILKQGYLSVSKPDSSHVTLNSILIANRGEIALLAINFSCLFNDTDNKQARRKNGIQVWRADNDYIYRPGCQIATCFKLTICYQHRRSQRVFKWRKDHRRCQAKWLHWYSSWLRLCKGPTTLFFERLTYEPYS